MLRKVAKIISLSQPSLRATHASNSESLELLEKQVLYYDTDSVIYKWHHGQPSIVIGDMLGEWKDELDGDIISEFVSAGSKNYAYKTHAGKVECKVRGFTLNARASSVLNFETMKHNILQELYHPLDQRRTMNIVNPSHFKRDLEEKKIQLVRQVKQYALVFDKRVINTDGLSFPYGFRRIGEELQLLMDL